MSSKTKKGKKTAKKRVKKEVKKEVKKLAKKKVFKRKAFNAVNFGGNVGSLFGKTGKMIGRGAGRLFRELTGFGDYKVSSNTLATGFSKDSLPMFSNSRHGTSVRHREFLGDVITSPVAGQFSITTVPIQPALVSSLPWLGPIAEQFDEYTIEGMVFEFKSNSYDALASVNTASGTVIMTTQYNVLAPPFTNKLQMEQYEFTCSEKPSVSFLHPVECARIETPTSVLTTRAGVAPGDLRLYDWGNFNIATVGMQGTSVNVGELWVTYDIKLFKPRMSLSTDVADHYYQSGDPLSVVQSGGPAYYGTVLRPVIKSTSSDMETFLTAADGKNFDTINWPQDYYGTVQVTVRWYSYNESKSPSPNDMYKVTYSGGAAPFSLLVGGSDILAGPTGLQMVTYTNDGATLIVFVTLAGGGSMRLFQGHNTPLQYFDLLINALPATLVN